MPKRRTPFAPRFWAMVTIKGKSDCWEWRGFAMPNGYGAFMIAAGVRRLAHRLSYELKVGEIPPGIKCLHRCDNPPCVNPSHLFLGTQKDNMQDCRKKGRLSCGASRWNAKLSRSDILAIRESKRPRAELARKFKVNKTTIGRIIRRDRWGHV